MNEEMTPVVMRVWYLSHQTFLFPDSKRVKNAVSRFDCRFPPFSFSLLFSLFSSVHVSLPFLSFVSWHKPLPQQPAPTPAVVVVVAADRGSVVAVKGCLPSPDHSSLFLFRSLYLCACVCCMGARTHISTCVCACVRARAALLSCARAHTHTGAFPHARARTPTRAWRSAGRRGGLVPYKSVADSVCGLNDTSTTVCHQKQRSSNHQASSYACPVTLSSDIIVVLGLTSPSAAVVVVLLQLNETSTRPIPSCIFPRRYLAWAWWYS